MIKGFAFFESQAYLFNNQVVKIEKTVHLSSGEYNVIYLDEFGKKQNYLADTKQEIEEDFIPTNQVYVSKPIIEKPKSDEYNLVYYNGKKKIETLKRNIPQKLAYALKNSTYKNDPRYKMGRIEVEHVSEKKTEGIIPGYTDPNKKNLDYNWDAIPKRDRKKNEGPNMLKISEIGIGDADPVKKFKEWNAKYWLPKKS